MLSGTTDWRCKPTKRLFHCFGFATESSHTLISLEPTMDLNKSNKINISFEVLKLCLLHIGLNIRGAYQVNSVCLRRAEGPNSWFQSIPIDFTIPIGLDSLIADAAWKDGRHTRKQQNWCQPLSASYESYVVLLYSFVLFHNVSYVAWNELYDKSMLLDIAWSSPTLGFQTDCASGKLTRAVREAANAYEVRKQFESPEIWNVIT